MIDVTNDYAIIMVESNLNIDILEELESELDVHINLDSSLGEVSTVHQKGRH